MKEIMGSNSIEHHWNYIRNGNYFPRYGPSLNDSNSY